MAGVGQHAVEQLRAFLRDLKPGARALLIAELEGAMLRGDDFPGAELILGELRRSFRENDPALQRAGGAARLFFQPLEPFLVDEKSDKLPPGRIQRSTLDAIWGWVVHHVVPAETAIYVEQVERALADRDDNRAEQLARQFQDRAVEQMQGMMAAVAATRRRRAGSAARSGRRGGSKMRARLRACLKCAMRSRPSRSRLPGHVKALSGAQLDSVKALLDGNSGAKPGLFRYCLVLTMGRLASPWQLIRLATRAANSDAAARIAETPYAVAVNIVLAEVERMVQQLEADLKSGRGMAVTALLKDVHDSVRGLRSELDIASDSAWGRQLASVRSSISRMLTAEIELMPGRVRRLTRPRSGKEIAAGSSLDSDDVTDTETLIGFVMACRNYASELAINEITQRVFIDLQQNLDTGTRALLDALRISNDRERPFRQSQVDAAVRFCAKVFGPDYAALLTKAAEVAAQGREAKDDDGKAAGEARDAKPARSSLAARRA